MLQMAGLSAVATSTVAHSAAAVTNYAVSTGISDDGSGAAGAVNTCDAVADGVSAVVDSTAAQGTAAVTSDAASTGVAADGSVAGGDNTRDTGCFFCCC
ncbi:hypothetical protein NDU88_002502 [Pleurodeles waltl]|uniref:Secreted protein n=1 Tax=Pleurodeles waltl TaxID=8319 RepID=A0AAV7QA19_PLEWA|nr:hypothetical protein NDU88_002502 [Pleurodeles waltl]